MKFSLLSKQFTFAATLSAACVAAVITLSHAADQPAAAYTGTPYGGKPQEIPGTIQAGNYDVAPGNANGIAWNRKGPPKAGKARTTGDCIGFGGFDGSHVTTKGDKLNQTGYYVGWTDPGDWWNYTVKVNEAGTYAFGGHLAAGLATGAKISVTFTPLSPAGEPIKTGVINVPTTAGFLPGVETYHVWEKLDNMAEVKLNAGLYIMTVKIEASGGMNIDTYTLTKK